MDVDRILQTLNEHHVEYLLIGGMNFLLRHQGPLTYDVDVWIRDTVENGARCEAALAGLGASWGPDEQQWGPVAALPRGWLHRQIVFCLECRAGAIDVFRAVAGLESWEDCRRRASRLQLAGGLHVWSLSDDDMLACQLAMPEGSRRGERVARLRAAIEQRQRGSEQ